MELRILNPDFETIAAIDSYESLIWTDRYCGYGDFELYTMVDPGLFSFLAKNNYVYTKDSDSLMIIESFQINTDSERGNHLTISGRSLESLLERRIIWNPTVLTGNLQAGIQKLLNENAISPTITERTISNLIFESSTNPLITDLTVEAQFTGDTLYAAIWNLCFQSNIGFTLRYRESDQKLVFQLVAGIDRSYAQTAHSYVVFSPKFDNLLNTNYMESNKTLKTTALVAGEGEGVDRITAVSELPGTWLELARRELFADARDIRSDVNGEAVSPETYLLHLQERGLGHLVEAFVDPVFEGQVEATILFRYGEDFFMGDVVQLRNEYGMEARSRVTEVVRSVNTSGVETFPTFTAIEE